MRRSAVLLLLVALALVGHPPSGLAERKHGDNHYHRIAYFILHTPTD